MIARTDWDFGPRPGRVERRTMDRIVESICAL
jgi:hypothetical protein